MKRSIVLSIILLLSFRSSSQTSNPCANDSITCVPTAKLTKAAVLIEKGRRDSVMLDQANKEIRYQDRIIAADSVNIADRDAELANKDLVIKDKDKEIVNLQEQARLGKTTSKTLNSKAKLGKTVRDIGLVALALYTAYTLIK